MMKTFDPSMFITLKEGYELTSCSCLKHDFPCNFNRFGTSIHKEVKGKPIFSSVTGGSTPHGVNLPALMTHGKGYQIQNILRSKNIPPSDKNAKNAIIKIYQIMTTHQH